MTIATPTAADTTTNTASSSSSSSSNGEEDVVTHENKSTTITNTSSSNKITTSQQDDGHHPKEEEEEDLSNQMKKNDDNHWSSSSMSTPSSKKNTSSSSKRDGVGIGSPLVQTVVSNVTETAQTIVHTTKKNTRHMVQTSKSTIESNRWLLPLKWIMHFPRHWPRTNAILWVVLLLWLLILISMGIGIKLAQVESPEEINENDAIVAARTMINRYRLTSNRLLNVTQICWNEFRLQDEEQQSLEQMTEEQQQQQQQQQQNEVVIQVNVTSLQQSLTECVNSFIPEVEAFDEASNNYSSVAAQSMSFNWNRCWPMRQQRQLILYPTMEMIEAARPEAQADYFQQQWAIVQQQLYQDYLPVNATEDEELEAFQRSVQDATGADACDENLGATAWFFFTIMTTVGYGNQAPVTDTGRLIVVSAGLLCLILFGVILGLCGYVILAIFDDAVSRLNCGIVKTCLGNPIFGLLLWGTIWIIFAFSMAQDFQYWWEVRLPEVNYTRLDFLWFSFISFSTIGLGDYYLPPEVMFSSDTLKYSVLFMVGFVILSTFFGKILETLAYFVPKKHNSLEHRLAKTRVLACWPWGWMPCERTPQVGEDRYTDNTVDTDNADDQALLYRIDRLRELKPDPPLEEDGSQHRGLVSALSGNSIHSMNVELLEQEAALLREWLAVVQHQAQRARAKREAAALPVHKEQEEDGQYDDNDDDEEAEKSEEDDDITPLQGNHSIRINNNNNNKSTEPGLLQHEQP
ncbi:ion channel [Nitzschia inconspicua]|uniref:Ion channel n=1 Tax=Nitzschia inconspicua TaxID=303405 RepID=A0A9K3M5Q9_9STRA|nr:ion channel [Nitzschia inconspicua]KAG7350043.1 ion channel [Nitzschia inconspicua]KAG7373695.1 ion channel [Nitzschia inconspicua]